MNLAFFSMVSVSSMSSLGCLVIVRALGNSSLGLYWLRGRVIAIIHAKTSNFVSAFVKINVCPPPFFGKMFTKSTDKNRVGPPPPKQIKNI